MNVLGFIQFVQAKQKALPFIELSDIQLAGLAGYYIVTNGLGDMASDLDGLVAKLIRDYKVDHDQLN